MNLSETMKCLLTSDSLTCYWEKSDEVKENIFYRIFLDGEKYKDVSTTHFSAENLNPDTKYLILVKKMLGDSVLEQASIIAQTHPERERIDITKEPYNAVGDGVTLNTAAIQRAIDDCGENQTVYIPNGVFLTGALRLHDNMEMFLEKDAVLQGSENPEDYMPRIWSRFEGIEMECYSSLLNMGNLDHESGCNCENIVIRGGGTIAGGGKKLAENIINSERKRLEEEIKELGDGIEEFECKDTIPGRVRPRLINMSNAKNIRLTNLTLKNSPAWNVHMIYSDNIVTDNCSFYSLGIWNGDGWDPDSSENCTLFGCVFNTGDDSVAIKSGKNPEGNVIQKPCRHIRIFDCLCACGLGIAIGSEMSGGVEDVKIWDCDLGNTRYGLEIKGTRKRGGYVKDVAVKDSVISRILFHSVGYNDDGEGAETPPVFKDCKFENLVIKGRCLNETKEELVDCTAIELCGFEEEDYHIKDVVFCKIKLMGSGEDSGKVSMKYCRNITFEDIDTI